jgi:hypothetical protein
MNRDLIAYFLGEKANGLVPIAVEVITGGDYHIYLLFDQTDRWYALIETDYPDLTEHIIDDIHSAFPVIVKGWYVSSGDANGQSKLSGSPDFIGTRLNYALAKAELKPGKSIRDFGLSYYRD